MAYMPTNAGWGAKTVKKRPPSYQDQYMAGGGGGVYTPFTPQTGWNTGGSGDGITTGTGFAGGDWISDTFVNDPNFQIPNPPGGGTTQTSPQGQGRRERIGVMGVPDYRGILDRYTADWRGRMNTGRANMETARLGNARSLINRLGIRDKASALAQYGKFGLTDADIELAANNPFSNLKAIDQQAREGRAQGFAGRAARGGSRSGGTSRLAEKVEDQRARSEAMANEEALTGLAEGQNQVQNWYQQQEDEMMQRSFQLEQELSQRYQPQTANWDDASGGYRWGNNIYDEYGNLIRTL